jgi:hypothetical protein
LGAWHSTSPHVGFELAQHDLHIVSSETNADPYDVDFGLSLALDDLVNYAGLSYSVRHSSNSFFL